LANQAPPQAILLSFSRTLSTDGVIERMVATTKETSFFLESIDCNKKAFLRAIDPIAHICGEKRDTFYDCLFVSCTKRIVEIGDRSVQ
jgi:hypothetical protein